MGGPRAGPGADVAGRVGRRLGGGHVFEGFELMCAMPFAEARKLVTRRRR